MDQDKENGKAITELSTAEKIIYEHYTEYCRKLGIRPSTSSEYFRVTGRF